MFKDEEGWSPDQELRLLEELAEADLQAFEFEEEVELPTRATPADTERPWVAYWNLPPMGGRPKPRLAHGK